MFLPYMAITSSAKKALRSSLNKRVFNQKRTREMRTALKEARKLVVGGKSGEAQDLLPRAYKLIDKAAKRGVIKKNTASRHKSRLSKLIKKSSK